MKRGLFFLPVLIACILMLGAFKRKQKVKKAVKDPPPNIIVILADDMGFSDAGCYGGEIHTPNIDFLAKNGVRYTQFYNTSRCCPTRASLLTGLYNQQAGIGKMTEAEEEPGYLGRLGENTVTLAEVLKSAGYQTAMSGKWHVSNTIVQKNPKDQLAWLNHQKDFGDFSPLDQYPTNRGFDRFFGTIWGVVDFFDPFSLVSGTTPIKDVPPDYYHTDAINDTAVAYINSFQKTDKPFFMYVAENAPHWPLQAKPEDIEKYKDTYKAGWDAIREARYKKMVGLGLIDPKTTKLPANNKGEVSWENNPDKEFDARAMAVHAAMIDRMDRGIGRIIDALRKTGKLDNTLIVFLSDNGASPENCAAYGPGFDRPNMTRDGRPIVYATKKQVLPGPQTSYASIGPRWARVANTPFKYAKAESYEGGVHTPMIAFWPKGITAKKGSFSGQVGHVMDFMNTFIEVSGAKYPATFKGKSITPSQGISLVSSFTGKKSGGHVNLFNEHFGARYVRSGNWKMVSLSNDSTWHLYDLDKDKSEVNDLAPANQARVKQMENLWKQWAKSNQVFPKPGRKD
ncbi:arylsulfatase [Arcticibacter tournemirensis]|uniref:Arylsulfatase n=1 Tax=Arcticibacter tournemirensis TaxID=699437 RepID=A0A5M9HEA6_9SPHI|nr:arylsulfatase [Arcticibacter tournemirensis]KAA8485312.1 arylsulfatase [Arcticibacter tournemirensis]TQM50403.1 arylsulfatase [Arcticibacter tournemirensis]